MLDKRGIDNERTRQIREGLALLKEAFGLTTQTTRPANVIPLPATPEQFVSEPIGDMSGWQVEESTGSKARLIFEAVLGQADRSFVEYKLYQGQGAGLGIGDLERRIAYLQESLDRKKRDLPADYKRAAIAYLQEELGRRRREQG